MSRKITRCPVCGKKCIREHESECIGTVYDYLFCERCGYYYYMNYSKPVEGIFLNKSVKIVPQIITLLWHRDNVRKYKIIGCERW